MCYAIHGILFYTNFAILIDLSLDVPLNVLNNCWDLLPWISITMSDKYSLLMHCIKIKSPAKFLLNEQYVFVGGNIYFLCVLSCSSEEA